MNTSEQSLVEQGEFEQLFGLLYQKLEAAQDIAQQHSCQTNQTLEAWVQTNQAIVGSNQELLKFIVQNTQALRLLTNSYENGVSSWNSCLPLLNRLETALNALNDALPSPLAQGQETGAFSQEVLSEQLDAQTRQVNKHLDELQRIVQQLVETIESKPLIPPLPHRGASKVPFQSQEERLPGTERLSGLSLSAEMVRRATVPLALLGGLLLMAGSGVGYAFAHVRQPLYVVGNTVPLTLDEAELLSWAKSNEGGFAKQLMDWNSGSLESLHCTQDVKRLGVTLEVQGRPADYGFCTLWVVPPQKRRFLESS